MTRSGGIRHQLSSPGLSEPSRVASAVIVVTAVALTLAGCSASIEANVGPDVGPTTAVTSPGDAVSDPGSDSGGDSENDPGSGPGIDAGADAEGDEVVAGGVNAPGNPFADSDSRAVLDWSCNDNDLDVTQDGSTTFMDGRCVTVTVTASWASVQLESVDRLVVKGDNCTVFADNVGDIVIEGSGNEVYPTTVTGSLTDTGRINRIIG